PEQQKHGTLTVKVVLVDPAKQNDHQPAAKALVHIQDADEDPHETNEQGQVTLSGISKDKVTLQIKVIGAEVCLLRDIPVSGGDQTVSVLVEKSQNGMCKRL